MTTAVGERLDGRNIAPRSQPEQRSNRCNGLELYDIAVATDGGRRAADARVVNREGYD